MKKHSNKNNLIFLFLTIIFLSGCKYQDIEIKDIKSLKLGKTNTKEINLSASIDVNNPNNYKIKIIKYDFDIKINGQEFKLYKDNVGINIPKKFNGNIPVSIKLTKKGQGILSIKSLILIGKIVKNRSINIEVKGYVKAGMFIVSKKIPVNKKRTIKLSR